ncbi:hypothetical protein MNJPNG_06380 [Cupriavidus oxalaticus]|uniref:phage tail assembly chaperone n=1 Tax=Cupriavidus oxalaticus TaxID=96344 RepID=UPI003F73EADA
MAFKLAVNPTFRDTVHVELRGDSGKIERSTFVAEFKRLQLPELEELKASVEKEAAELPVAEKWRAQANALRQVLVGWSQMVAEDGRTVLEFNDTNLELLLVIPQALTATQLVFWTNSFGNGAREKN